MSFSCFNTSPPARTRPKPARSAVRRARHAAVALAFGLAAGAASAAPVTFAFEGSLTQDPYGISQFGAPVSGRYTFEAAALDDIADPRSGSYTSAGPAFGFSAVVDGLAYTVEGSVNIGTQAGLPGLYLVTARAGGLTLELALQDVTGSAVLGDALPLTPPNLSAFALHEFRLFADDAEFTATLDRLQLITTSVPEPGTTGLLLSGLGAAALLAAARRRRPIPSSHR